MLGGTSFTGSCCAPQSNLGSLDDTGVARFSVLKPIEAAVTELVAPPPSAPPPASLAPPPPPPLPLLSPVEARSAVPAAAPEPEPVAAARPAPVPEPKPVQRYAVQLVWARDGIDLSKIPSLAIFGGYLLYAVETEPGGRRMYGVRLGFYADALSARLVAQYVRSEFKGVAVVPVSEREVARATSAAIRLPSSRSVRGGASAHIRWPPDAVTVAFTAAVHNSAAAAAL